MKYYQLLSSKLLLTEEKYIILSLLNVKEFFVLVIVMDVLSIFIAYPLLKGDSGKGRLACI
ncbi:MAG: hypothetical protein ACK55K_07690, partial [Bacteroidota bacterium]